MRFFILLFLSLFLLTASAQTEGCEAPKGINGEHKTYYSNGKIHVIANYQNGILHGSKKEYYENGNLRVELEYRLGSLTKKNKWFYEDGQIACEITARIETCYYESGMVKSKKDVNGNGKSENWWPNGNKRNEEFYYNNKKHGISTNWDESGKLISTGNYFNDLADGIFLTYFENGQLKNKKTYSQGKITIDTVYVSYHANGKIHEVGNYENGYQKGLWRFYDNYGRLIEEGNYNNGKTGPWKKYGMNGKLKKIENFSGYQKQGYTAVYDENELCDSGYLYHNDQIFFSIDYSNGDTTKGKWEYIPLIRFEQNNERENNEKFLNSASGHFENGKYYYDEIKDVYGNVVLKTGSGKYFNLYENVFVPQKVENWDIRNENNNSENFWSAIPFSKKIEFNLFGADPWVKTLFFAKGKFENGVKQGEWMEGNFVRSEEKEFWRNAGFYSYEQLPKSPEVNTENSFRFYAVGNYVNGNREGKWKFFVSNLIFEGDFIDGKKEGFWKLYPDPQLKDLTAAKIKESYFFLKMSARGKFHNDLPDGIWKFSESSKENIFYLVFYKNQKNLGIIYQDYLNGQPKIRTVFNSDSTEIKKTFFTPLGDTISENNYTNEYPEDSKKVKTGKYYRWEYSGKITFAGHYLDGKRNGHWYELEKYKDDTSFSCYYVDDLFHGRYMHKHDEGQEEGMYNMGKKTGLWKDLFYTGDRYLREITYTENDSYTHSVWDKKGIQLVKNGEGIIKTTSEVITYDNSYPKYYETVFKNGKIYCEKQYYKNRVLKQEIYHTRCGDSLANYNTLNGSKCIYQGNGYISHYDQYNLLEKNELYSGGKIVKDEKYIKGKFMNAQNYFYSSIDTMFIFQKKINKNETGDYEIEIRIKLNSQDSSLVADLSRFCWLTEENNVQSIEDVMMNSSHKMKVVENGILIEIFPAKEEEVVRYTLKGKRNGQKVSLRANYLSKVRWYSGEKDIMFFIVENDCLIE